VRGGRPPSTVGMGDGGGAAPPAHVASAAGRDDTHLEQQLMSTSGHLDNTPPLRTSSSGTLVGCGTGGDSVALRVQTRGRSSGQCDDLSIGGSIDA
jgi:hypothetical protein